jgi:hypothetical protein
MPLSVDEFLIGCFASVGAAVAVEHYVSVSVYMWLS